MKISVWMRISHRRTLCVVHQVVQSLCFSNKCRVKMFKIFMHSFSYLSTFIRGFFFQYFTCLKDVSLDSKDENHQDAAHVGSYLTWLEDVSRKSKDDNHQDAAHVGYISPDWRMWAERAKTTIIRMLHMWVHISPDWRMWAERAKTTISRMLHM
jgi:hypothetical protein